jgi:hypothetical protein
MYDQTQLVGLFPQIAEQLDRLDTKHMPRVSPAGVRFKPAPRVAEEAGSPCPRAFSRRSMHSLIVNMAFLPFSMALSTAWSCWAICGHGRISSIIWCGIGALQAFDDCGMWLTVSCPRLARPAR